MNDSKVMKRLIAFEAVILVIVLITVAVVNVSVLQEQANSLIGRFTSKEANDNKSYTKMPTATDQETESDSNLTLYEEDEITFSKEIEEKIASMTTEGKAAQLFMITTKQLTGVDSASVFGDNSQTNLEKYPVGGIIFLEENLVSYSQFGNLLKNTQAFYEEQNDLKLFTAMEENGGKGQSPIADAFGLESGTLPFELGSLNDTELIHSEMQTRAEYLKELGINTLIGPYAETATEVSETHDQVTFSSDYLIASKMVKNYIDSAKENDLLTASCCFSYSTAYLNEDSDKTNLGTKIMLQKNFKEKGLPIWKSAIRAGTAFIIVNNDVLPGITENDSLPCSMSPETTRMLRDELKFDGILITDMMNKYSSVSEMGEGEACVKAINAGMDMVCCPDDFKEAYQSVLEAIESGEISKVRVHNALGRILTTKNEI